MGTKGQTLADGGNRGPLKGGGAVLAGEIEGFSLSIRVARVVSLLVVRSPRPSAAGQRCPRRVPGTDTRIHAFSGIGMKTDLF